MTTSNPADRRGSVRHLAPLVVRLQPLNADRQPLGEPVDAVSLDVSQGGLRCVGDRPLLADLAIVSIQAATCEREMLLLAERIRCQRVGPMFEMALRFVEKVTDPNPTPST